MARSVEDFFAKHGGAYAPSLAEIVESVKEAEDHKWVPYGSIHTVSLGEALFYASVSGGTVTTTEVWYGMVGSLIAPSDPEADTMEFIRQRNDRNG